MEQINIINSTAVILTSRNALKNHWDFLQMMFPAQICLLKRKISQIVFTSLIINYLHLY